MSATSDLQSLCEQGQEQLVRMDYLAAEATLVEAEQAATEQGDFDTLGRLYMPLQEARRQRRQRCGEGTIQLNILATGPDDPEIDPASLIDRFPWGQLLIAGWGSIEPAMRFRQLQAQRRLFVETYLAAVYPTSTNGTPRVVVIVPLPDVRLPPPLPRPIDALLPLLPAHSIVLSEAQLPSNVTKGTPETYAETMALWEHLHAPFLAAADAQIDAPRKIDGYRQTIRVDYACELAHQKLSDTARNHARELLRKQVDDGGHGQPAEHKQGYTQ